MMMRLSDEQFVFVYHQLRRETQEQIDHKYPCGNGGRRHYRVICAYLLKSAFVCQEKAAVWKMSIIAFIFLGIAGILSALIEPIENNMFAEIELPCFII